MAIATLLENSSEFNTLVAKTISYFKAKSLSGNQKRLADSRQTMNFISEDQTESENWDDQFDAQKMTQQNIEKSLILEQKLHQRGIHC